MYKVSEDYKNMLSKNVRTPKNKIVVDGVAYGGRLDLLTFPKITQETTMMIGGFPAKTVEFELYNKDGTINLLNKDVAVYRGYDIGKLAYVGDATRTTNVTMTGIDFSKGFSIKLRGFFDASKLTTNYSRLFGSANDTTLINLSDNPNVLVAQIYTVGVSGGIREPKLDLSPFTKEDFLTITFEYDLTKVTITATNGEITVTNSVEKTGELNFGSFFYIGSRDLTGNPIFEYDSVEIETTADNKKYKFIADEIDKWKSVGDRVTYTINGKWDISDNTEYIPMGIYKARAEEDVTNNSTNRKIIFKGTDRAVDFNRVHSTINDPKFPCTYLEYLKSILERYGYALETEDFPFANSIMTQPPNISNNVTDRELISRFAEMCGGIAQMSRSGKVAISMPLKTETEIPKTYYSTLSSKGKEYGFINTVVLGRSSEDGTVYDDITTIDDTNNHEENGSTVWRIDNNPFLDLIREQMIDAVAENIFGQNIIPFQLDECVDDFLYDLNDIVKVQDKMGSWFETRILSINSTGRIKTSYGAYTQEETTSYNLVGSAFDAGKTVQLDVNRITGEINAINQTLDGYGTQFTQTEQNFQFLFNENNEQKDYINFENGTIIIGKVDNEYKLVQYNDRIIFLQNQQETAKLLYNLFFAEDIKAGKSLQVDDYILETDGDGGLDLDWGGE